MIYFEVQENERGDDVSKTLFSELYANSDDAELSLSDDDDVDDYDDTDVRAIEDCDEILKYLADSPSKASASTAAPPPLVTATAAGTSADSKPLSDRQPSKSCSEPSPFVRQLLAVR